MCAILGAVKILLKFVLFSIVNGCGYHHDVVDVCSIMLHAMLQTKLTDTLVVT